MSNNLIARLLDAVNGEHDMTPHGADVLQAVNRIEELEDALRTVDGWIDDIGLYAQKGSAPAAAFKRVKEVLSK